MAELTNVQKHEFICRMLNKIYEQKNHDYGDSFHISFEEEGMAMPRIRLGDKFNRFKALTRAPEERQVADESILDTLLDMANYAIMTAMEVMDFDVRFICEESVAGDLDAPPGERDVEH